MFFLFILQMRGGPAVALWSHLPERSTHEINLLLCSVTAPRRISDSHVRGESFAFNPSIFVLLKNEIQTL